MKKYGFYIVIELNKTVKAFASAVRTNCFSSDNGTNLVGAANYMSLSDSQIQNSSVNEGIQWKFNPPRLPQRDGLWESAVKSLKYHLNRCTNERHLHSSS